MSRLAAGSEERGLLFDLLTYAASEPGSVRGIPARRLAEADDHQMQWISQAGLAPLLYRASREEIDQVPTSRREMLLSAHLTAMVWQSNLIDATREIVEACQAQGVSITLLKGISISDQYYPEAHLRPMSDIDVLAPASGYLAAESAILELGYKPRPHHQHPQDAHDGAPLFHPKRRLWVEVHNALFPKHATISSGRVFSAPHVAAHTVSSTFHGSAVNRLADELQLVYIASSWVRDLSQYGIHASHMPPLLDALYLVNASNDTLAWDDLLGWLDNPMASASLYLMLSFLSRHGLCQVDPSILSRLASSQSALGPFALRVLHRVLERYLIGGKPFSRFIRHWHVSILLSTLLAPGSSGRKLAAVPWNILFPPSITERYSVRYQLGRIARALRGPG